MEQKFDNYVLRYTDFILRWRWVVIILTLFLVGFSFSGAPNLSFSSNYRIFFSEKNPELIAFESFQNTYTKNDNIMYVLQPADKDLTKAYVAAAIEDITKQAWQIPYAIRVDSVTNFQHSYAQGDDLIVDDFIYDSPSLSPDMLKKKWKMATNEPLLYGNLLALDSEATGINVTLQYPEKEISEIPTAVKKARSIAEDIRKKYPDIHIAITGVSMMNNAFMEAALKDATTLTPLMYLILIIVMLFVLRSISAIIAIIFVIGFSVMIAVGWAGHMGVLLAPISVLAPTVILTLAIADSIHILISMLAEMREGNDKISALKDSVRINFIPIFITSITTIIGFLSLNFLDTPPFHDLGNITAVGIGAAWLLSMTFLPAILSLFPIKTKLKEAKQKGLHKWIDVYANFVITRRRPVLIISICSAIILISLLPKLEINDQWVNYFDHSIPFRADAEFGMNELTGAYMIEFSVDSNSAGGISNPEYLKYLNNFTNWLRNQPETRHVYSYTDIIKKLNKNMHGDDEDWYKIPQDRQLAAQYLLLYELSLPYGLDLNDRINIDKSATRISAVLGNMKTKEIHEYLTRTENWLKNNFPSYMNATPTGPTVMFSYISERNIHGMLRGNAIAIVIISIIIMLVLRSFGIGLLSLIPNAVPILMTFGLWAIIFGQIGMASASVSAIALGIVVDDSVHFLTKYLRARREKKLDKVQAIHYAFHTVGVALFVTTVILTIGFLVMVLSSFQVNKQLGLMTSMTMVVALIMDFTLLPTLLMIGYKNKTQDKKRSKSK
ncbi:MAG: MMPL family transporter [Alphaproteobacteria bacterium]|nr:MMPL family transporter [Alphaproteobacteria bacterium]